MSDFSADQQKAMETIQKLLALAANNPNEAEAASAASKANEMLAKYNLDLATVGEGKDGAREELKVDGGFHEFQRNLWASVARLNFCMAFTQKYTTEAWRYVDDYSGAKSMQPGPGKTRQKVQVIKNRMCLIGRLVNTRSTTVMVEYLMEAIDRLLGEALPSGYTKTSNWAISFRQGCTRRILEMIAERRDQYEAEEREKERKAQAAAKAATGPSSSSTAVTLTNYKQNEQDANMDFVYGEGYSARVRARRAQMEAEANTKRAEYEAWKLANPEEAAAKEKEAEDEAERWARKHQSRGGRNNDRTNYTAYFSGYDKATNISLNPQVNKTNTARLK